MFQSTICLDDDRRIVVSHPTSEDEGPASVAVQYLSCGGWETVALEEPAAWLALEAAVILLDNRGRLGLVGGVR